jgi:hypothetical protein
MLITFKLLILFGLSADFLEAPAVLLYQLAELNLQRIHGIKERLNPIRLPAYVLTINIGAQIFQHLV